MEEHVIHYGRGRWITLLITVVLTFMCTLDGSIVNVALPHMAVALHVGTGEIAWVVSAYLITITIFILIFGRLGDLKGQGRIFRLGLLIFTFGSFLCGVTSSLPFLVAARVVQAVGAAASLANSYGIITRTFPPAERGRALGINSTFVALGSMVGPSLGGFIISFASWKYLFWVNVPIGLAAYFAHLRFPGRADTEVQEKLDWPGGLLFMFAVVPLFIALEHGQAAGYLSPLILSLFAVSVLSFTLFFILERKAGAPLLELDIFKNKWFSVSIFCAFTSFVAISCSNIILPFYLQNVLKMTPGTAGLYMTVYPLVLVLVSPVGGCLADKINCELLTLVGLSLMSFAFFMMATLDEAPVYWMMVLYIALISVGNGLFQPPNGSLIMSMIPRSKLGIGGSVTALVRNLGFVFGISLSTSILYGGMSIKMGRHITGYAPGMDAAFIFGMRLAYIAAASICLLGTLMTAFRLCARRRDAKKQEP